VFAAGSVIRQARVAQGLTQAELARRMEVSQPAVARMEAAGDGVTMRTFRRAIWALGRTLEVRIAAPSGDVDETLVAAQLRMSPNERLERYEHDYEQVREFTMAADASRGMA
jgi:UDP-N-acetylglucosamine 1-carboxyvinyltransferase